MSNAGPPGDDEELNAKSTGSGEGRGGEKGRSRWAPDHLKKKKKGTVLESAAMKALLVKEVAANSQQRSFLPSPIRAFAAALNLEDSSSNAAISDPLCLLTTS